MVAQPRTGERAHRRGDRRGRRALPSAAMASCRCMSHREKRGEGEDRGHMPAGGGGKGGRGRGSAATLRLTWPLRLGAKARERRGGEKDWARGRATTARPWRLRPDRTARRQERRRRCRWLGLRKTGEPRVWESRPTLWFFVPVEMTDDRRIHPFSRGTRTQLSWADLGLRPKGARWATRVMR